MVTLFSLPIHGAMAGGESSPPERRTEMSNDRIVRRSRASSKPAAVDWSEFDALSDEDIASATQSDPDAAPLADEEWFEKARLVQPLNKAAINIRLDQEVLDFFKSQGAGYQTRMNSVLRAYMEHEKNKKRA
jgi:uncharacterized protein (DUF4415 family)